RLWRRLRGQAQHLTSRQHDRQGQYSQYGESTNAIRHVRDDTQGRDSGKGAANLEISIFERFQNNWR
ncbi:hypothetical protein, partial [Ferrovibrio sp.]|uniref:hypothetical protein n=1 Tax=Ferrovibrio sp. TaxID=1917215 RepID=UPI000CA87D2B